jgi:hypothetical protein
VSRDRLRGSEPERTARWVTDRSTPWGYRSALDSRDEPWLFASLVQDTQNERAVANLPSTVGNAASSDGLSDQEVADGHAAGVPTDSPGAVDQSNDLVGAVLGARHRGRHGAPRERVDRRERLLSEGLVGTLLVVLQTKQVERPLLSTQIPGGGRVASSARVLCMRSWRPFCSGCPGSMRSGVIPSCTHQTASLDRPPTARVANGGPLSVRMRAASPNSVKARSKCTRTCASSVMRKPSHLSRNRLAASPTVNG